MQFKYETVKFGSKNYPNLLKEIQNPPLAVHVRGRLPDESKLRVAIVGTRKATSAGKNLAKEIGRRLAESGIIIVSGLAMGIDTAAHEGALAGKGLTLAVLGCGIDTVYPAQNNNLAEEIIARDGAIISEYGPGVPSFPNQFLERNRIVAGLCAATKVIEAPRNSGAIVTARLAAESGREVLIFPGLANHPNYVGSHKLIRDGARLVSSFEDIIEDLSQISNFQFPIFKETSSSQLSISKEIKDKNQLLIIQTIQEAGQPVGVDKISELTKLEPQIVNQKIAFLVVSGIIKETEKGYAL